MKEKRVYKVNWKKKSLHAEEIDSFLTEMMEKEGLKNRETKREKYSTCQVNRMLRKNMTICVCIQAKKMIFIAEKNRKIEKMRTKIFLKDQTKRTNLPKKITNLDIPLTMKQ